MTPFYAGALFEIDFLSTQYEFGKFSHLGFSFAAVFCLIAIVVYQCFIGKFYSFRIMLIIHD